MRDKNAQPRVATRKPWAKPVLKTITAGSAEKNANNITPDGQGNQKS